MAAPTPNDARPAEEAGAPRRLFSEASNVGRVRYVVSFHDGTKAHADGSPFYDVRLFANARVKARFVRDLLASGYQAW